METEGIVKNINGSDAEVLINQNGACESCDMKCAGCISQGGEVLVTVSNTLGAAKGDKVLLLKNDKLAFRSAFLVFMCPLLLAAIGYLALSYFASATVCAVTSVAVFLLSFFAATFFMNRMAKKKYPMKMISRL